MGDMILHELLDLVGKFFVDKIEVVVLGVLLLVQEELHYFALPFALILFLKELCAKLRTE